MIMKMMKNMKTRMIKMTKMGVIMVFVVAVILSAAMFYYANMVVASDIENYNLRKEDVYSSQQRIEQSLSELNQTLQAEIEYRKSLTDQVAELYVKADEPPPVINVTKTTTSTPIIINNPAPSRPTTRAS